MDAGSDISGFAVVQDDDNGQRTVLALVELAPPLPCRVAITGLRAASFAHEGDTIEITVVLDFDYSPSLEPRLANCAATATKAVPSVQPNFRIISTQQ